MKRVIIDIDDAYAEVLTVTACGRDGAVLNVHTQAVNLREQDHVRVPCDDKAKKEEVPKTCDDKAKKEEVPKTCETCLYEDSNLWPHSPCEQCERAHDRPPSRWEPKEEAEG